MVLKCWHLRKYNSGLPHVRIHRNVMGSFNGKCGQPTEASWSPWSMFLPEVFAKVFLWGWKLRAPDGHQGILSLQSQAHALFYSCVTDLSLYLGANVFACPVDFNLIAYLHKANCISESSKTQTFLQSSPKRCLNSIPWKIIDLFWFVFCWVFFALFLNPEIKV